MDNHKGQGCPHKPITCQQEGTCQDCRIVPIFLRNYHVPEEEAILVSQANADDVAEQIEDLLIGGIDK